MRAIKAPRTARRCQNGSVIDMATLRGICFWMPEQIEGAGLYLASRSCSLFSRKRCEKMGASIAAIEELDNKRTKWLSRSGIKSGTFTPADKKGSI